MRGEHKKFETELKKNLTLIGFNEILNDDFTILFKNEKGWGVSVDSERYYDGVFRWIISPDGFYYSIFHLIRLFEEENKKKIKLKKNYDWIKFISQNKNWIFRIPQPYRLRYEEMD